MHHRFQHLRPPAPLPPAVAARVAPPPAEAPGPDGIRWGLVNRIKAELAAGTYDIEAKWALAEERLLRAAETA